jgi:signal transduction histidine kinase
MDDGKARQPIETTEDRRHTERGAALPPPLETERRSGPDRLLLLAPTVGAALAVLAGLYASRLYSYLLFHSLVELFGIVVACATFMVFWNTRRFLDNSYVLLIAIASLFVAGIDLLHTLSYKGMNVFSGSETNLPTQLWVAARFVQSLSFLIASLLLGRKVRASLALLGYGLACAILLLSIFGWRVFPTCYVEGSGLTAFKRAAEYVICAIFLASAGLLWRKGGSFEPRVFQMLTGSIAVTIAGELAFTLYVDPYGLLNLVGHYLKLAAFYLIYRALIQTSLVKPYSVLFRELKQTEENLKRTVAELADSNAELEQFARVASHDLQAPLVTVSGFIQLLARRYQGQLDADADSFIDNALEGVARMQQMIHDILTYSRVGRQGPLFELVACSSVLEAVLENLHGSIQESHATVSACELPIVRGDGQQLLQLFQNLVGNALKFRGAEAPAVRVQAERREGAWLFSVSDNGIGFPPEAGERIFRMFERLHGVSEYPGSGMGLAICRKIAEHHGGQIWAESQPGKGATFFFTLPA